MSTPRVCLCPTSSCPWPPWGLACPAQEEERVPRTEAPAICARKRALLSPGRLEKQVWAPGGTARAAGKGCARGMPEHGSLKLGTWQDPRSPGSCHRDREEVKRHSETGCLSPWAMFKVSPARCPRHASHISQRRYAPGYGWYVLPPPPHPPQHLHQHVIRKAILGAAISLSSMSFHVTKSGALSQGLRGGAAVHTDAQPSSPPCRGGAYLSVQR